MRESRDSDLNPASTAIVVGLDVTGSMGMIADALARKGRWAPWSEEIWPVNRCPIPILCAGIGDVLYDRAPLQVTQFRGRHPYRPPVGKNLAGKRRRQQFLRSPTPCRGTSRRCIPRSTVSRNAARKAICSRLATKNRRAICRPSIIPFHRRPAATRLQFPPLLTMNQPRIPRFHVIVEEGSHARRDPHGEYGAAGSICSDSGDRPVDHRLAEVIVSAIEVNEGRDRDRWRKLVIAADRPGGTARRGRADTLPGPAAGVVRF